MAAVFSLCHQDFGAPKRTEKRNEKNGAVDRLWFEFVLLAGTCLAGEVVKPITLKYADGIPENSWFGKHHKWWANEVEKRSGDKETIKPLFRTRRLRGP